MRVLVTGHEGYIGAVMVQVLQDAGHDVVGLDSGLYRGCDLGPAPARIPTVGSDVRDVTAQDLAGIQAVVHLAAISNDPIGELNTDVTYEINHRASVHLAEQAREAGVHRFVFASSCSLYGASEAGGMLDESAHFLPVTAYGESKILAERDIRPLASDTFSPTFMRNATVYGASPRLRGDVVVNNLTGSAFATGKVHLLSDGTPWRPLIHVRDVCRVAQTILAAPRELIHNVSMNVSSSDENYRIRDVAEIVHRAVPGSELTFAEGAGPDLRNYRVDGSLLARLLPDAVPQWTVADGVRELLEWFGTHGLTEDALRGPRFTRLARIRELTDAGRLDGHLRWTDAG
ncbi:MAG: NAD(P)-dependent oxidoreductase [Actinobacteria bacterium]|nr:NAD(P)-dependent oxidoreductase [Thermoleophilia bacterium]MCB9010732.1 NAD(P)-dependent oxidoreductase [Actinomycetota bacterium]